MVVLTPDENRIPFIAKQRWICDRAHEEHVVLLRLRRGANPTVSEAERVQVTRIAPSLTQIVATFGYMEPPRIAPVTRRRERRASNSIATTLRFSMPIRKSSIPTAATAALRNARS